MEAKEFLEQQIKTAVTSLMVSVTAEKAVFSDMDGKFKMSVPLACISPEDAKQEMPVQVFLAALKETVRLFDPAAEAENKLEEQGHLHVSGILAEARMLEEEAMAFRQEMQYMHTSLRRAYEESILSEDEWAQLEKYRSKHRTGWICRIYGSVEEFMAADNLNLEEAVTALVNNPRFCVADDRILEFEPAA